MTLKMTTDEISLSLSKSVEELEQKLMQTEQSINDLEQITQRCLPSISQSMPHDETSSLPPPLTVEELMLQSTLQSSCMNDDMNEMEDYPVFKDRYTPENFSETSVAKLSSSFYLLHPSLATQPTPQLTSSPRKNLSKHLSYSNKSRSQIRASNCGTLSANTNLPIVHPNSYNRFKSEFKNSQIKTILKNDDVRSREDQDGTILSSMSRCKATLYKNDCDETLPGELFQDYTDNNISNCTSINASPQRPISARSNATSVTLTAPDSESDELKNRLLSVRSDNARLRTLVAQLRQQLAKYMDMVDNPVSNLNSEQLSEKIVCLLDEIKANEKTLRNTEDKLEYKEKLSAEKDQVINKLKNKVIQIKAIMQDSDNQRLSAESARKDAERTAAELSQKLKQSQMQMSSRLQESQKNAHTQLSKAASDRTNLLKKCEVLTRENEVLQTKLRGSQSKLRNLEAQARTEETNATSMMNQAQDRIRELVAELEEKHLSLKKCTSEISVMDEKHEILKHQYNQLQDQNQYQRERLVASQKDNEESQSEIDKLKESLVQLKQRNIFGDSLSNTTDKMPEGDSNTALVSLRIHKAAITELEMKLSSKENHIKRLEARLANCTEDAEKLESLREELMVVAEKSRSGERRANELEDTVHKMEDEKAKYMKQITQLEDHIHDKIIECESLEDRLKERTSHLSQHQVKVEELREKVSNLETELKQNKDKMLELNNKIKEQASEDQSTKLKMSELQAQLLEKARELDSATEWTSTQEAQSRRDMKKVKKVHTEQCQELGEQIETLQQDLVKSKKQSSSSKQQILLLNEQVVAKDNCIQQLQNELDFIRREEATRTQTHQEALRALEEKSASSSNQVKSLENALAECRNEISVYIDQLHETHSNFQHQLALKSDQVSRLESELKLAQSSLRDETGRMGELESALSERHKMLEGAASRISELEESQCVLQSQVAKLEQQLSRDNTKADQLIKEMENKLKVACLELDSKKHQFAELNNALKKVDEDFNECKAELTSVEKQLHDLQSEAEVKTRDLERSRFEWKEMKAQLDSKIERVAELELHAQSIDRELKKAEEKNLSLETDIAELRNQTEDALQHNSELQVYNQNRNADLLSKDATMKQLKEALTISRSEYEKAQDDIRSLERSLEERQWQLQQRAAQLGQLDAQLREFRNGTEKRNIALEGEVELTKSQLRERNAQVAQLDDVVCSMRSEIAEVRRLLDDQEHNVKRQDRELSQKNDRIEELTKTIESERQSREERHKACIDASQELRVTREREQMITRENQELQREVSRLRKEIQQLIDDMKDMGETNHEKDERLGRVTKQLSSLASEKISIETQYREELDRTQHDIQKMREQHQTELENLRSVNAELLVKARVASGNQEYEIQNALERERESREEAKRAKEALVVLENELQARKQVIDAGNDTIIVKDAEIARLQAKLSGMERGVAMASLPNTPVKLQSATSLPSAPASLPTSAASFLTKISSKPTAHSSDKQAWTLDDTTNSLFTGIDSDLGSIGPSFMPIAASTKRHPGLQNAPNETSSFFLTSSPTHQSHVLADESDAEDDSLYRRVFAGAHSDSSGATPRGDICSNITSAHRRVGASSQPNLFQSSENPANDLRPEKCMANLHEKLRASEQRRREVTSKLRNLKGPLQ